MNTDDSRGLESPDRPHASIGTLRVLPDGGRDSNSSSDPNYRYRLEVIDYQASKLLDDLATDDLEVRTSRDVVRHCREIRAELESVRLLLCDLDEDGPANDATESTVDDEDEEPSSTDGDDVPMIVRRDDVMTTVLGPDPDVFERTQDRASENDEDLDVRDDDHDDGQDQRHQHDPGRDEHQDADDGGESDGE